MDKLKVYNRLPILAQNMACNLESFKIKKKRYDKEFWRKLSEYEDRKYWSTDKLMNFQNTRLNKIINHCYNTVPYYNEIFDNLGLKPNDIQCISDLSRLPILTKDIVNSRFEDFISTSIDRKDMVWSHTNGTTGSGFRFLTTKDAIADQWAVWWRYRRNVGISFDTKCAIFGGQKVVPVNQKKPPYWRYNKGLNQIYFSVYHLSEDSIEHYLRDLIKLKIEWIHGYPSAIALIAQYIINNNIAMDQQIKYITTGSENLLDHQEALIKSAFGIKPYQHYGLAEGVSNISHDINYELVVDEDFSVTEFVDVDDQGLHIIGTTLTNFAMPLLRYDTKDIAALPRNHKKDQFPRIVDSIDGRKEDYIILKNGRSIGRLAHIFADLTSVKEAQIYQYEINKIMVKIVKSNNFTTEDERKIMSNLHSLLGSDMIIRFNYEDKIERTNGGKLRFVISDLK
jgi:phenylacetate-CoA ligase